MIVLEKEYSIDLNEQPLDYLNTKKVWWVCDKGHVWHESIEKRLKGKTCPYCYGYPIKEGQSLLESNPLLASEFHPYKNGTITPDSVSIFSHNDVWWKCEMGHEWFARVGARARGTGCPKCKRGQNFSYPEIFLYCFLKTVFPNTIHRYLIEGYEYDIFIPELNTVVEFSGTWFHSFESSQKRDITKEKILKDNKIPYIKVR